MGAASLLFVQLYRQPVGVAEEYKLLAGIFVRAYRLVLYALAVKLADGCRKIVHLESKVAQTGCFGKGSNEKAALLYTEPYVSGKAGQLWQYRSVSYKEGWTTKSTKVLYNEVLGYAVDAGIREVATLSVDSKRK